MDDSALISRMREGDRKAFNILYARHVDICRGYAELMVGNMFSTDIVRDDFRLGFTAAVPAEGDIQQGIEFHPRDIVPAAVP